MKQLSYQTIDQTIGETVINILILGLRSASLCGALLALSGCIGSGSGSGSGSGNGNNRNWSAGPWPTMQEVGQAAKSAAGNPQTWAPLVGAGLLQIDNVDQKWSRELARDQSLFGDDPENMSDTLRDVATGAYLLTALLAPSETYGDKARGLAVGGSVMILDGIVSQGLKEAVGRERPDGSNDQSLPSGHASKAASRSHMAIRNLAYFNLPAWQRQGATWLLHGVAAGTGLARVEASKHHLSDVLVGYAVGHFVAEFMYQAFMQDNTYDLQLSFVGVEKGGALTLTLPLR